LWGQVGRVARAWVASKRKKAAAAAAAAAAAEVRVAA
jgi:hypothetical protein